MTPKKKVSETNIVNFTGTNIYFNVNLQIFLEVISKFQFRYFGTLNASFEFLKKKINRRHIFLPDSSATVNKEVRIKDATNSIII